MTSHPTSMTTQTMKSVGYWIETGHPEIAMNVLEKHPEITGETRYKDLSLMTVVLAQFSKEWDVVAARLFVPHEALNMLEQVMDRGWTKTLDLVLASIPGLVPSRYLIRFLARRMFSVDIVMRVASKTEPSKRVFIACMRTQRHLSVLCALMNVMPGAIEKYGSSVVVELFRRDLCVVGCKLLEDTRLVRTVDVLMAIVDSDSVVLEQFLLRMDLNQVASDGRTIVETILTDDQLPYRKHSTLKTLLYAGASCSGSGNGPSPVVLCIHQDTQPTSKHMVVSCVKELTLVEQDVVNRYIETSNDVHFHMCCQAFHPRQVHPKIPYTGFTTLLVGMYYNKHTFEPFLMKLWLRRFGMPTMSQIEMAVKYFSGRLILGLLSTLPGYPLTEPYIVFRFVHDIDRHMFPWWSRNNHRFQTTHLRLRVHALMCVAHVIANRVSDGAINPVLPALPVDMWLYVCTFLEGSGTTLLSDLVLKRFQRYCLQTSTLNK